MSAADLFPETLLVSVANGQVITDSPRVASYFGRAHKNVMRTIEQVIKDMAEMGEQRLNFEPLFDTYTVQNGAQRKRLIYRMDRKTFAILAGRFTGKQALLWQIKYHEAFEAMEAELHAVRTREAAALYKVRPRWEPIARHPELPRKALIGLTGHTSPDSITACRARMRQAGLL